MLDLVHRGLDHVGHVLGSVLVVIGATNVPIRRLNESACSQNDVVAVAPDTDARNIWTKMSEAQITKMT